MHPPPGLWPQFPASPSIFTLFPDPASGLPPDSAPPPHPPSCLDLVQRARLRGQRAQAFSLTGLNAPLSGGPGPQGCSPDRAGSPSPPPRRHQGGLRSWVSAACPVGGSSPFWPPRVREAPPGKGCPEREQKSRDVPPFLGNQPQRAVLRSEGRNGHPAPGPAARGGRTELGRGSAYYRVSVDPGPSRPGREVGEGAGRGPTRKLISLKRNKEPWCGRLPSLLLGWGGARPWGSAVRARRGGTNGGTVSG